MADLLGRVNHLKTRNFSLPGKAALETEGVEDVTQESASPLETWGKVYKEDVEGPYDPETGTLVFQLSKLKDQSFFPSDTYRLEASRGSTTIVRLSERWHSKVEKY